MLQADPQLVMRDGGLAAASGGIYGSRVTGNKDFFKSPQPAAALKHGILQRYVVVFASTSCQASCAPIGTPAGSGSSWVCRLPATTSHLPVFRGVCNDTGPTGSLVATDDGPEPHRPAIRHRSPEPVGFTK